MTSIYEENVLDHYRNPRNSGTLEAPDIVFKDDNPLCGDTITIHLQHDSEGNITKARHFSTGCAISQAATSMLFERLEGMRIRDALKIEKDKILEDLGTELSVSRVKCALLGLTALKKALVQHAAETGEEYA
jgi:nitrogen fixation NifU-like protein